MLIEKSLKTKRDCPNAEYASKEANKTGKVRPLDDHIALANVFRFGFPKFFDESLFYMFVLPFASIVELVENVDDYWMERALKTHCRLFFENDIHNDPTFKMIDTNYFFSLLEDDN